MSQTGDLFGDEQGRARRSDPQTSKDAAAKTNASRLEQVWLDLLRQAPKGGLTAKEVAEASGEALNAISPRMKPLENKNLIEKTGERRGGSNVYRLKK